MPEKIKTTGIKSLVDMLTQWITKPPAPPSGGEIGYTPSGLPEYGQIPTPSWLTAKPADTTPISTMGFPTQQLGTPTPQPKFPNLMKTMEGIDVSKITPHWQEVKETEEHWAKLQKEHKEYLIEFNKGKVAWEKWEKERMDRVMEMYKYAQEHNIPSYKPTSGQVALGMPFGVPQNIAPMLMQGITQQENERQRIAGLQEKMTGFEPEVLGQLPPDVTGMPAEYQEAFVATKAVKEEKSKDKERAIGLLGQYITSLIQKAPEEGIDPSERILQIIQTATPEQLEQEFGYPLTYQDIIEAFSSIMKVTAGEFGG